MCPAGERLAYNYTTEDKGLVVHRYVTNACRHCAIKHNCTKGKERRISRWEHEHVIDAVQADSMSIRRRCVNGARRSSIPSAQSRRGWEQPTS